MRKIKVIFLVIVSTVLLNITYAFFLFDYDKKPTIALFSLYLIPEEFKTPTNILTRKVASFLALRELKQRKPDDKMIEELVGFTVLTRNRMGYSEEAYDKAINFLNYLRKKRANFFYGEPCSKTQAILFILNEGKGKISKSSLEMTNLRIFLLNEKELNNKNRHAKKSYCHQSINSYLNNPIVKSTLEFGNIDDIITDLRQLEAQ